MAEYFRGTTKWHLRWSLTAMLVIVGLKRPYDLRDLVQQKLVFARSFVAAQPSFEGDFPESCAHSD